MRNRKAKLGDWLMTCDRTGRVFHRSEMKQEWTGIWVHNSVWEAKHPQEDIIPRKEQIAVNPARAESDVQFISFTPVTMPASNLDS